MQFLKVAEVAHRLAIQPELVKQFIVSGRLEAIKIPTPKYDSFRVSEESYDKFVESLKVVKEPERKSVRRRKRDDNVKQWV